MKNNINPFLGFLLEIAFYLFLAMCVLIYILLYPFLLILSIDKEKRKQEKIEEYSRWMDADLVVLANLRAKKKISKNFYSETIGNHIKNLLEICDS
jgi:hypothetical protein